jgi:membrane protease YdiL (CAAX protease family)
MGSEIQAPGNQTANAGVGSPQAGPGLTPAPPGALHRIFLGPQGLRAGWSAAMYLTLLFGVEKGLSALGQAASKQATEKPAPAANEIDPVMAILGEAIFFAAVVGFAALMALIERRHILDYNLRGTGRLERFLGGLAAGFLALSALVGALYLGGWMHFGPMALSGWQVLAYAALWGVGFLLVGFSEEGVSRCYLQFTLARGINFWWALGVVALMCADLLIRAKGQGVWGVYIFALPGFLLCLGLHLQRKQDSAFWCAAWATSTFFGFMHTGNNGENWIGIFAASLIGFVFCVSIRITGSAWWAIGCHAAWDWAETFFYGTADSGYAPKGHLLTTAPAGSALWSGGTDGPEGSLLVLPTVALILAIVLVQYGRGRKAEAVGG